MVLKEESRKRISERLGAVAADFRKTKVDPKAIEYRRIDGEESRGLYRPGASKDYLAAAREELNGEIGAYYTGLMELIEGELVTARNVVSGNKLPKNGVDWTMRQVLLMSMDNTDLAISNLKDSVGRDIGFTEVIVDAMRKNVERAIREPQNDTSVDELTLQLKRLDSIQSIADIYSEQHQVDALESIKQQVQQVAARDPRDEMTGFITGVDSTGAIKLEIASLLTPSSMN